MFRSFLNILQSLKLAFVCPYLQIDDQVLSDLLYNFNIKEILKFNKLCEWSAQYSTVYIKSTCTCSKDFLPFSS